MILTFFGSAIVGVVEAYFMKGIPDQPEVVFVNIKLSQSDHFKSEPL
jgi:hypothetical protein